MSYDPPVAPTDLSTVVVDELEDTSPGELREIAQYAEALAEYREREARLESGGDAESESESTEQSEEIPDGVPSKATITIKEINDNRYYYWQWRDGDTIRSQYKGPVEK